VADDEDLTTDTEAETADSSGESEVADSSGESEVADSSGESEVADSSGESEVADSSGESAAPSAGRYGAVLDSTSSDVVLHVGVDGYFDVASAAKDDGFDQLIDLTAVDYLTYAAERNLPTTITAERFEVVVQLINHRSGERVRVRVQVPADAPELASLFDLWPGSESLEREVYDMFGIEFTDHPDMSRVLMPDDWVGHPLRKDYAVGSIPVQFKAASNIR
jgi:NADH-quinone oxidoreductase subunit C